MHCSMRLLSTYSTDLLIRAWLHIHAGFRIAKGGAQEMYGVVPDMCSLGKIPGGGFPMGA